MRVIIPVCTGLKLVLKKSRGDRAGRDTCWERAIGKNDEATCERQTGQRLSTESEIGLKDDSH